MNISRGFIALVSMLIISSLLLLLTSAAGTALFLANEAVSHEVMYRKSLESAWSCAHLALGRLDIDMGRFSDGAPTHVILSDTDSCTVESVNTKINEVTVLVSEYSGLSKTSVLFTALLKNSHWEISSWREY